MAELKVEPADTIVFAGASSGSRTTHTLTNTGSSKVTTKVKCTHPDQILATPVFSLIEPGATASMTFVSKFKDTPDPKGAYRVYILYAVAPGDATAEEAKLRQAWTGLKDFKTHKLGVEFKPAAAAPPAEAPPAGAPEPAAPEAAPPEPAAE